MYSIAYVRFMPLELTMDVFLERNLFLSIFITEHYHFQVQGFGIPSKLVSSSFF
jgi:hypothetical protein